MAAGDDEVEDEGLPSNEEQRAEDGESNPKKARKEKYFESDRVVAKQIAAMRGSIVAWKAECAAITSSKNLASEELYPKTTCTSGGEWACCQNGSLCLECRGMEADPVIAPVLVVLNSRMRALAL
eukprot:6476050-Amphidinium_carterae.1